MKKLLTFMIFSALSAFAFTSCELEVDGNGDLDGYWKLTSVDTLQTGGNLDMNGNKIFWAVQKKLLYLRDQQDGHGKLYLRFNHSGDSLLLSNPYINDRDEGDVPLSSIDSLRPFGINALNEKFLVEKLESGKMILKSNTVRLNFKKF